MNETLSFHARNLTIALAMAVFPTALWAQSAVSAPPEAIKVGDAMIDGSILKPYKNAWKIIYAFPGKEPFLVGTWTDELTAVEINEQPEDHAVRMRPPSPPEARSPSCRDRRK